MTLRTSEVAQCQCCEQHVRLGELIDVTAIGERVEPVLIEDETDERFDDGFESPWIGGCPHCGHPVYVRNVA